MAARCGFFVGILAAAAWGQTPEKVFYFSHIDSPQAMQELTNAVRSIGDIRDVSLNAEKRSLTVKGTAEQIAIAGWMTAGLDISGGATGSRDLPVSDARAPLAQIYYLSHVDDPRDLQEIVNAVRSVVDIQRFFPVNRQKAIVMRGSPAQVKAADWLLGLIDKPVASVAAISPQEYRLSAADWEPRSGLVVQVVSASHLETPQAIQETVNLVRSLADIQRFFPLQLRKLMVIRASEDQIGLANWLMNELHGPGVGTKEFKVGGPGNQVAQVAFVNAQTAEKLQETVNEIRKETKIQRVFPCPRLSAVAMRGTADQLAQAQQVIRSR